MSPANETPLAPIRVLVVGGSYAGLAATLNLLDLCSGKAPRFTPNIEHTSRPVPVKVTIVDERDGFYHLIGSPLALASEHYSPKGWMRFEDLPALRSQPDLKCVQGSMKHIDLEQRIATITNPTTEQSHTEKYDYLIVASGLRRVWPVVPQSLTKKTYLYETSEHIHAVKESAGGVVVVGGGAVGIEMATELKTVSADLDVTLIHSRSKLLSAEPLPDEFKDKTLDLVRESGVKVILDHRVLETTKLEDTPGKPLWKLKLNDGTSIHQFSGEVPHKEFHFATGDIVPFSGIKRCGGAMGMGLQAAVNIHQHILSTLCGMTPKYMEWPEYPPMIALAVGKTSISYTPASGVKFGEDVMKAAFGDDLGLTSEFLMTRAEAALKYNSMHELPAAVYREFACDRSTAGSGEVVILALHDVERESNIYTSTRDNLKLVMP
ncbi:pyridine nucleotide-disulfide oxidoreductase AMID-like [Venturia nashicola]|nr:pyridine nucleotide-disulfide oxidoreductase AMID-like [Venturia nashicola]